MQKDEDDDHDNNDLNGLVPGRLSMGPPINGNPPLTSQLTIEEQEKIQKMIEGATTTGGGAGGDGDADDDAADEDDVDNYLDNLENDSD